MADGGGRPLCGVVMMLVLLEALVGNDRNELPGNLGEK